MKGEFSKKNKYILVFAFCFMTIPALQGIEINSLILICGLATLLLAVQLFMKKEMSIFSFHFSYMDWIMFILTGIGLIDGIMSVLGIHSDDMYGLGLLTISVIYFATRTEWELTIECMAVIFFSGVVLIVLSLIYFIMNTDILLGIGMKDLGLIEGVAVFIGLIGAYIYSIETNRIISSLYCAGTLGCMVCLALCGNDITLLLFMIGICLLIVNADREINVLRKLLICLFFSLFIPCNAVLLVNYSSIINVEVSVLSLQESVMMELILALIGIVICTYWERVEKNEEDAIRSMQMFFKSLFRYLVGVGVFLIVIGIVNIFIGMENILRLFHDGGWNPDGIIISTLVEFSERMSENIMLAYRENMMRLIFDAYGIIGIILAVPILGVVAYQVWNVGKYTVKKDVLIWILSALIIVECIVMPMRPIMFPIYTLILFKTIHGSVKKEKVENEREVIN